jgi:hypothetical protein
MSPAPGDLDEPALRELADVLATRHRGYAVILYGSRARGTHRPDSDVDLLLVRREGGNTRDVRSWRGVQVDAFISEESGLEPERDSGLLRIRQGRLLRDETGFGAHLIQKAQEVFARGPVPLPPEELKALRVWCHKMLQRVAGREANPVQADYRRVSFLTELLPLYFQARARWFLGPEESLRALAVEDPRTHEAFARALAPEASLEVLERLVCRVLPEEAP